MSNLMKYDPLFTTPMSEFMKRFFGGGLLPPFDSWSYVEDDIQPLAVDVFEKEGKMVVEASLPGVKPGDLDITINDNILTIKAETKQEREEDKEKYHYRERRYGAWQRKVLLPEQVNADKADAEFEDGVLKLSMPIVGGEKTKRIKVKTK